MNTRFRLAAIVAFMFCHAMALAQNLSGTLVADDTGNPIAFRLVSQKQLFSPLSGSERMQLFG